ncbi:MAG: hypothetical protein HZA62_04250 [Rhodocyclales bacterium]|nr:hypothetical protein [Rhodocyclales bacterium]
MPTATLASFIAVGAPVRLGRIRIGRRQDVAEAMVSQPGDLPGDGADNRIDVPKARLASATLLSATLHLALVVALAGPMAHPAIPTSPAPLLVRLTQTSAAPAASDGIVTGQAVEPAATPRPDRPEVPTRAAHFLVDPDLSVLEAVPVNLPGSASLRLQVNAKGIVERVTLMRNDPAPKELIDGLVAAFAATRLTPALVGDRPSASSVEVTVRFEPELLPIAADQK